MALGQQCLRYLLPLVIVCIPALAQTVTPPEVNGTANVSWDLRQGAAAFLDSEAESQGADPAPETLAQKPYGWRIAVYPVLAWAPVFGASVTLPPLPSQPITTPGPSGSTASSLNGAFFGGARFETGKWSADALFMWAALSAERKTPFASVNLDFIFGNALLGREVLPDLYVEGGIRRLAVDVHATVGSDSAKRSPGFWDPLVGLTYRRQLGRKWRVLIHGDGGGFGVGSDVDVTASGRAEWQFARHFGVTMGYGGMHFSESNTVSGKTLTIRPTLHGPIFGFGIYF